MSSHLRKDPASLVLSDKTKIKTQGPNGAGHSKSKSLLEDTSVSADRVQWECAYGSFLEDLKPPQLQKLLATHAEPGRIFSTSFPNLLGYGRLVRDYTDRLLTYPEDTLAAFSGITSVLSHTFYGGFICGLPALFLDVALVWQPDGTCERRIPSKSSNRTKVDLPSWPWVGWRGKIDSWSWNCRFEYLRLERREHLTMPRKLPLVQWYSHSWNNMDLAATEEPSELQEPKKPGLKGVGSLPLSWRRFEDHSVAYEPKIPQT